MPAPTVAAISAWLTERGRTPGPLFLSYSLNPANREHRLITHGAYRIVRNLGAKIGISRAPAHAPALGHHPGRREVGRQGPQPREGARLLASQEHRDADGLPRQHDERARPPRGCCSRDRSHEARNREIVAAQRYLHAPTSFASVFAPVVSVPAERSPE
jgi:hypothetical protein